MGGQGAPILFAIPGDIETLSGGYGYARAVMSAWRETGIVFRHVQLPGNFPFPAETSLDETLRLLRDLPGQDPVLIDGLAYGAMPVSLIEKIGRPIIVLHHHPLGLETGLDEARAQALIQSERAALGLARHVVVTSDETALTVRKLFNVPDAKLTVAVPGTTKRARAARSGTHFILSVASITPRKGHLDLIAALRDVVHLGWDAAFVGSVDAAPDTARQVKDAISEAGLTDRIAVPGAIGGEELDRLFAKSTVFALASYYEGYGMAFAEAMAAGLPIVGYRAGAVPDLVPPSAGVLVDPGDRDGLRQAVEALLTDPQHASRMADGAYRAGETLPGWTETARKIQRIMESCA